MDETCNKFRRLWKRVVVGIDEEIHSPNLDSLKANVLDRCGTLYAIALFRIRREETESGKS